MSFQKVKPTKPELTRLKKKRNFSQRGESLLEIKREQLHNLLQNTSSSFFRVRNQMRETLLANMELLKETYQFIGKEKVERISLYNLSKLDPKIELTYIHRGGIDLPEIKLKETHEYLPSYSFYDTALHIDILIKNLHESLKILVKLGELDKRMYRISENYKKINRRIDALEDLVIPKLNNDIRVIEDILSDGEREEFIRLKKIKEFLEIEES
ncbi:MAG: V-type ATP synthase subunit D [Candidatus Lokiarchaeota archaeon]|nr:V-type ATP synthase subunit D [Candidatus Harpocratesius repetitus]